MANFLKLKKMLQILEHFSFNLIKFREFKKKIKLTIIY
jgi:hypothetical protein